MTFLCTGFRSLPIISAFYISLSYSLPLPSFILSPSHPFCRPLPSYHCLSISFYLTVQIILILILILIISHITDNVEMEIVLPGSMTVIDSHDIALALQHKIEAMVDVERAFVHVDHQERDGLEHKVRK